jgi:dynein heavy chain
VRECVKPLVESSIMLYEDVTRTLRPIPAKPHYTFNLRDLSKVIQGVLRVQPSQLTGRPALLHLWWHECLRTFSDRLVDGDDRAWLRDKLLELGRVHWKGGDLKIRDDDLDAGKLVYAAFSTSIADVGDRGAGASYGRVLHASDTLPPVLHAYLEEYTSSVGPMPLVFFPDAIEHVCRLARVLSAPRGSAMLVGVGGSGKQSLTRFASFACGQKCFQIELRKGYSAADFREDLKGLYVSAGGEGVDVTFLFCDSQIVSETLLEDVDSLLNSGEVRSPLIAADGATPFSTRAR